MDVVGWLLDGDPAVRWQVRRDLLNDPAEEVAAERDRVAREGWGAQLLDRQDPEGTWGGAVWLPEDRTATDDAVLLLAILGVDPGDARVREAVGRVKAGVDWGAEWDHHPFFVGEVEPCINGRVLTAAAWLGEAREELVALLLSQQQDDGGWNCYARTPQEPGSFHSTICVLEGLTAYRDGGGPTDVAGALARGHEYLLERRMMRRRRDGVIPDEHWLAFHFPAYWHYDVLRGLDQLRAAGVRYDDRAEEAVALVESKRLPDGRWLLDRVLPGRPLLDLEAPGEPSRMITLRALRVLDWAGAPH
jgi:Asp-tRNA(Asn)/Glu-tRNA(Gln) amidotransferase A subunit family amidase